MDSQIKHHSSGNKQQPPSGPAQESKLYLLSVYEPRDPLDHQLEDSYNKLQSTFFFFGKEQELSAQQFTDLSQFSAQSKQHQDEVSAALLFSILTDQHQIRSKSHLRLLLFISPNTGSAPVGQSSTEAPVTSSMINNLLNIISEHYAHLLDQPRQQLLWLIRELTRARLTHFDKLLTHMLRNIQSGLLSDNNIWLCETILDIFYESDQSMWLYSFTELLTQSLYTYLRILADHAQMAGKLQPLRQREAAFCCQLLKDKWPLCALIGRDLVRLLHQASAPDLPQLQQMWSDLLSGSINSSLNVPSESSSPLILQLLKQPTRRRCLISRLTLDMERKIYFLLTQVKHGQHKRYLDWFAAKYLSTPESQSLRVDLCRYICVVVHPSNEQLMAGFVPRWYLCSWLLNGGNVGPSQFDQAQLKLALFYDWLLYDTKRDNIMLIEPAILLLCNSVRAGGPASGQMLAANLFDFLARLSLDYYVPMKDQVQQGIQHAFKDCVDKRVIPSLQMLVMLENGKTWMDPNLRQLVLNAFPTMFGKVFEPVNGQASNSNSSPSISFNSTSLFNKNKVIVKQQPVAPGEAVVVPISILTPTPPPVIKKEPVAAVEVFSDDENTMMDDDNETQNNNNNEMNLVNLEQQDQEQTQDKTEEQIIVDLKRVNVITASTAALNSVLEKFSKRPFKTFYLDEVKEELNTYSNNDEDLDEDGLEHEKEEERKLDQLLSLIDSDELRNKLLEFNANPHRGTFPLLLQTVKREMLKSDTSKQTMSDLTAALTFITRNEFSSLMLTELGLEIQEDGYSSTSVLAKCPLLLLYQTLSDTANQSTERELFWHLLNELGQRQPRLNYLYILYLLTLYKENEESGNNKQRNNEQQLFNSLTRLYRDFCNERSIFEKKGEIKTKFNKKKKKKEEKKKSYSSTSSSETEDSEVSSESSQSIISDYTDEDKEDEETSTEEDSDDEEEEKEEEEADSDFETLIEDKEDKEEQEDNNQKERSSLKLIKRYLLQDLRLLQQDDAQLFIWAIRQFLTLVITKNKSKKKKSSSVSSSSFFLNELIGLGNNNSKKTKNKKKMIKNSKFHFLINNSEFIYLIVSCCDFKQLNELLQDVSLGQIILIQQKKPKKQIQKKKQQKKIENEKPKRTTATAAAAAAAASENKKRKRIEKRSRYSSSSSNSSSCLSTSTRSSNSLKKPQRKSNNATLIKFSSLNQLIASTLKWESIEQMFFWQLFSAHTQLVHSSRYTQLSLAKQLPLFSGSEEALNGLYAYYALSEPFDKLLHYLFVKKPKFLISLLITWCKRDQRHLCGCISRLVEKCLKERKNSKTINVTFKKLKESSGVKLTAEQQLEKSSQEKKKNRTLVNSSELLDLDTMFQVFDQCRQKSYFICFRLLIKNQTPTAKLKKFFKEEEQELELLRKVYPDLCDSLFSNMIQNKQLSKTKKTNNKKNESSEEGTISSSDDENDEEEEKEDEYESTKSKKSKTKKRSQPPPKKKQRKAKGKSQDENDDGEENDDDESNNDDDSS